MERRALLATAALSQMPPPKKAEITSSVMLWTLKGPFEEKLEIAARAGIQSVELVFEHTEWTEADIRRVKHLARSFRLGMDVLGGMPHWKKLPVSMVDPSQRDNMLREVQKNIDFARKLEIPMVLLMSGLEVAGLSREGHWASLVEGCKHCGDLAARAGVKLVVEPLNNKIETPGFFLTTCVEGLKLIKEVDHPHVRLLFDIYHEQVQTGNLIQTLNEAAPFTEIFHVADNPGRHEPGTGEIYYPNVYKAIRKTGYTGYITMEYLPLGDAVESLTKSVDGMRDALALT